jgi:hypothetical protein
MSIWLPAADIFAAAISRPRTAGTWSPHHPIKVTLSRHRRHRYTPTYCSSAPDIWLRHLLLSVPCHPRRARRAAPNQDTVLKLYTPHPHQYHVSDSACPCSAAPGCIVQTESGRRANRGISIGKWGGSTLSSVPSTTTHSYMTGLSS